MASRLTLADHAKIIDPMGKVMQVVEIMNQMNPIVQDLPAYPSNAPTGHRVTFRSSLPTVAFTKINKGTSRSKGETEQRTDSIGLIAGLSEVDTKIKRVIGAAAVAAERAKQDDGFVEAIAQLLALTILYGDTKSNEASFDGLAPRLASLQTSDIHKSIVKSMGSVSGSDGTSIFIVDAGERAAHLIFPEASTAGIETSDKGEIRVTDADSNPMMAFVTEYNVSLGLSVEDPRHIARLANIDVSDANLASPTQGAIYDALSDILALMPPRGGNTRVMYCHPLLYGAFRKQAMSKATMALTMEQYLGQFEPHFDGCPIRRCEQVSITETTVS